MMQAEGLEAIFAAMPATGRAARRAEGIGLVRSMPPTATAAPRLPPWAPEGIDAESCRKAVIGAEVRHPAGRRTGSPQGQRSSIGPPRFFVCDRDWLTGLWRPF